MEKCIYSAKEAVSLSPEIARLYPVVILEDTELAEMFRDGRYSPFSHDESVQITAEMYKILQGAGINIIRVGLKSTDVITTESSLGSTYHPSFRQLVEGRIAMERILKELSALGLGPLSDPKDPSCRDTARPGLEPHGTTKSLGTAKSHETPKPRGTIEITCSPRDVSNAAGLRSQNRKELERLFPGFRTRIKADETIEEGRYVVKIKRL